VLPNVIKIFDKLLKRGNIKINHIIPSSDELKRHAYCKWHDSFSSPSGSIYLSLSSFDENIGN
jgi:hypothetical protein